MCIAKHLLHFCFEVADYSMLSIIRFSEDSTYERYWTQDFDKGVNQASGADSDNENLFNPHLYQVQDEAGTEEILVQTDCCVRCGSNGDAN